MLSWRFFIRFTAGSYQLFKGWFTPLVACSMDPDLWRMVWICGCDLGQQPKIDLKMESAMFHHSCHAKISCSFRGCKWTVILRQNYFGSRNSAVLNAFAPCSCLTFTDKRETLTKIVIKKHKSSKIQRFKRLDVFCPLTTNGLLVVIFNSPPFPPSQRMLGNSNFTKYSCYDCDQSNKKHVCIFTQFFGMKGCCFYPLVAVANWVGDGMDPIQEVPWPLCVNVHKLQNGSVSVILMHSTGDLFGLCVLLVIIKLST